MKELYAFTNDLEFPHRAQYECDHNWLDLIGRTVGEFDNPDYTFIQSEDDVQVVRELIGGGDEENFRYYIVKELNGEFIEVWGCDSPATEDSITRIL